MFGTYFDSRKTARMILDVRNRCNSALDMLQKFVQLENLMEQFLAFMFTSQSKQGFYSRTHPDVEGAEWPILIALCDLLKPFKAVTTTLSGYSYPTFALPFPLLRRITSILSDETFVEVSLRICSSEKSFLAAFNQLKSCQRILSKSFKDRFISLDAFILSISCLGNRLRRVKHFTADERRFAKVKVVEGTLELSLEAENVKSVEEYIETEMDISSSTYDAQDFGTFDSPPHTQQLSSGSSPDSDDSQIKLRKGHIQVETGNYLCLKPIVVSSKKDPLQWWNKNESLYPNLARTARKWLSVCATSTASERVFSSRGVSLTAKRSKLRGSTSEAQTLLKKNFPCSDLSMDHLLNAL